MTISTRSPRTGPRYAAGNRRPGDLAWTIIGTGEVSRHADADGADRPAVGPRPELGGVPPRHAGRYDICARPTRAGRARGPAGAGRRPQGDGVGPPRAGLAAVHDRHRQDPHLRAAPPRAGVLTRMGLIRT